MQLWSGDHAVGPSLRHFPQPITPLALKGVQAANSYVMTKRMPTQQQASKSKSKAAAKTEARVAAKPAAAAKTAAPKKAAGGAVDFTINRKWSKTLEPHVGAHIRVELPENALRGMQWQLHKLPHGVALDEAEIQPLTPPEGLHNQNRVFNFSVHEEGDYLLQFNLAKFGASGQADMFKLKLSAKKAD